MRADVVPDGAFRSAALLVDFVVRFVPAPVPDRVLAAGVCDFCALGACIAVAAGRDRRAGGMTGTTGLSSSANSAGTGGISTAG